MAVLLYGGPRPEDRSKVSLIPRLRIRRIIGYAESGSAVHMRVPECEVAHIWKITRSVFHRRTGITRRSSWSVVRWLAAGRLVAVGSRRARKGNDRNRHSRDFAGCEAVSISGSRDTV